MSYTFSNKFIKIIGGKMKRWKNGLVGISDFTNKPDHSTDDYFENKNYEPKTAEESQIFDEFSLVTSSMAVLIHIAKADSAINSQEKEQIINDMIFQLEQRPYELTKLSEKFGSHEKEIILNIYDKILKDYQTGSINLDKIVDNICLVYQNNPEKSYYLIRLCYYCAFSDNVFSIAEKDAIEKLAFKMNVSTHELKRIEEEVKLEVAKK